MSETNRNLRGIDKANQEGLWQRPSNPSQVSKGLTPVKDTKPVDRSGKVSLPVTKSLTDK